MTTSQVITTAFLLISITLILFLFPNHHHHHHHPITSLFDFDDPDDLSLFRRASSPSRKISHLSFPHPNPLPKIAFLFLTNSNLTFSPLWDRFFNSSPSLRLFNIYVHADPRRGFSDPLGHFQARLIHSKPTERASPTLIAAARRLLATAILDDPFNFYFAVVSQHCVPLHSFGYVYSALFGRPISGPGPNPFRNNPLRDASSFKSFIEVLSDEPNLHERYVARGDHAMLPEVPFDRFRVGSQFFILTKPHALTVIKDRKLWRKFRLPCLNNQPCYPEEHYFPTLLDMMDGDNCSGYTLTRVNWTGCYDGHPRVYQPGDVSADLVRNLRQSEGNFSYFFARKFSPDCLPLLMDLADDVIFRD
ncbi:hypothetical protein MLD38_009862 [Melastoma candidum]|uniref:Uncharacterized protein n=1 Tax=Melastoma candidum TaxID=119954 RepID=A0ACB9RZF4_9MYRT|nr:hypothetical protein MLD38_009862 [Melastoma candidum]